MRGIDCRQHEKGLLAHVAQSVERVLGKDEVTGSIPVVGSALLKTRTRKQDFLEE